MENLTVQAYLEDRWQDIAKIVFSPKIGDNHLIYIDYIFEYAINYIDFDDEHCVSLNHPVSIHHDFDSRVHWLHLLDDLLPSGSGRDYWVNRLSLSERSWSHQNIVLLKHAVRSPIGHLRIKESISDMKTANTSIFKLSDVVDGPDAFFKQAHNLGCDAGDAAGAGGNAPKLLICYRNEEKITVGFNSQHLDSSEIPYLVKFPRGSQSSIDCDVLRAEYFFYHELASMGFDTISTRHMRLEEGGKVPSLWLPRFDIFFDDHGRLCRYGMESVYSMLNQSAGSYLDHESTLRALIRKIGQSHMIKEGFEFDIHNFVNEWVQRDLLNIIFGNSDNHGRNTAFLRYKGTIKLAPIFDFAPMKCDPEGVHRTTMWSSHIECGGEYNFSAVAEALDDLVPAEQLLAQLKITARQCLGLKNRLIARGVPKSIIDTPSMGMDYIPDKLKRWGLL